MMDDNVKEEFVLHALNIAHHWRLAGRWHDTLTVLRGALPVADELNDTRRAQVWLHMARTLNDMATFGGIENTEEQHVALDCALRFAEASGDASLLGVAWDSKGMAEHAHFLNNGRFQESEHELEFFERGLTLREQAGDARGLAESQFHLGLVYQVVRGDSKASEPYFERSYALAKEANDAVMQSYAIRHIAFVRGDGGDVSGAVAGLEESLALREQAGFRPGVAMALFSLAEAQAIQGRRDEARAHLIAAREILDELGAVKRLEWIDAALSTLDGG